MLCPRMESRRRTRVVSPTTAQGYFAAMGSFTELTLGFTFASDVPQEVLGAFSQRRTGAEAPELPALEETLDLDDFDPDDFVANWLGRDLLPWSRCRCCTALPCGHISCSGARTPTFPARRA